MRHYHYMNKNIIYILYLYIIYSYTHKVSKSISSKISTTLLDTKFKYRRNKK